ncbi:hypothetical protein C2R22_02870 [Salinigranum rubrum]|uniref:KaiC-like domain-containing protein n=1 Tax=Salinigranum rubrum TaxID=755307 RepID=A0A2I8VFL8_9EURY|nr:hypothetical protein C2R22_02870 [Salinigranum rubrum]
MDHLDIPSEPSTLSAVVGDATSALLVGPTGDDRVTATAVSFLASPEPTTNHVHWATMLRSPADAARTWADHATAPPDSLTLVEVGETRRSFGGNGEVVDGDEPSYTTARVESPSDLTTLGLRLTEGLASPSTGRHRIWFESLSTLLQFVPPADAFRFVHTLTGHLAGAEAAVWFHLDPALHDPREIHTFLSVCDAQIRVDVGGDELVVERR